MLIAPLTPLKINYMRFGIENNQTQSDEEMEKIFTNTDFLENMYQIFSQLIPQKVSLVLSYCADITHSSCDTLIYNELILLKNLNHL